MPSKRPSRATPGCRSGARRWRTSLWSCHLRFNPADPQWPGRDRFVLSAGHGCMLLYSLLHLTGYDLPCRELSGSGSGAAGRPAIPSTGHTDGVETTTGPLGQGAATASAWPSPASTWPRATGRRRVPGVRDRLATAT